MVNGPKDCYYVTTLENRDDGLIDYIFFRGPYRVAEWRHFQGDLTPFKGAGLGPDHGYFLATFWRDASAPSAPPVPPVVEPSPLEECLRDCANDRGQCRAEGRPPQVCKELWDRCVSECRDTFPS